MVEEVVKLEMEEKKSERKRGRRRDEQPDDLPVRRSAGTGLALDGVNRKWASDSSLQGPFETVGSRMQRREMR